MPGDNVGFNVRGLAKGDIRRGDVCGPIEAPPTVADEFTAQIVVLQHRSNHRRIHPRVPLPYHPDCPHLVGSKKKLDPRTGQTKEENPTFIKAGDVPIVQVKPTTSMVIENVKRTPLLSGRFAIRDMGSTIAAGICIAIQPKQMR